ncbi:ferredoxin [Streptomyces sp. NPDC091217]|uniref:ferredoxin n=1 Tax=Streptomyces sp. NPDC091217 TaxID=3365975 RepID=UPI0037F889C1
MRADDCVGSGICAASCPQVFAMDGDRAVVIAPETTLTKAVRMASLTCPAEAIDVSTSAQSSPDPQEDADGR